MKTRISSLLVMTILAISTSGCQTFRVLGAHKVAVVETTERIIPREAIPTLDAMYRGTETTEHALYKVQTYCANVAQDHRQRHTQKRTHKNIFATLGVIAGTIIAPTLAQGSAIKAWAGVSGASAGALSTLFDSSEGEGGIALSKAVLEMSDKFSTAIDKNEKADEEKQRSIVREMLFFCQTSELRPVKEKTETPSEGKQEVSPVTNSDTTKAQLEPKV